VGDAAPLLLLLRVLLGLEPADGTVEQHPSLPERITELGLRGLPGPAGKYDAFAGLPEHAR